MTNEQQQKCAYERGCRRERSAHVGGVGHLPRKRLVRMEVRYPRAGWEPLICRYLPLPTVKCGYAENLDPSRFRMRPESCPRATAPQFSPAISFLAPSWSQFQIPKSRPCTHPIREVFHDQSRHGARSPLFRFRHGWTASFTNFHAPPLGAAIFGEPEQNHVLQASARPPRKRVWPNQRDPKKSHPSRGGPERLLSLRKRRLLSRARRNLCSGAAGRGRWFLTLAGVCVWPAGCSESREHLEAFVASISILFYY